MSSFAEDWVEKRIKEEPLSEVLRALSAAIAENGVDEEGLLKALRQIAVARKEKASDA